MSARSFDLKLSDYSINFEKIIRAIVTGDQDELKKLIEKKQRLEDTLSSDDLKKIKQQNKDVCQKKENEFLLTQLNTPDKSTDGLTPLYRSVLLGNLHFVKILIEAGVPLNDEIQDGVSLRTPLIKAAENGNIAMVKTLIEAGANVDAATSKGATALMIAAQRGHQDIIQLLIDAGADLESKYGASKMTALMFASEAGHLDAVRTLVGAGADAEATDQDRYTSLQLTSDDEIRKILTEIIGKPHIDQSTIIDNCIEYLKIQKKEFAEKYRKPGKKEEIEIKEVLDKEGMCAGFSALWLFAKMEGNDSEELFYALLKEIAMWDRTVDSLRLGSDHISEPIKETKEHRKGKRYYFEGYLASLFEQVINDISWAYRYQNVMETPNLGLADLKAMYETIKGKSAPSLVSEFKMAFIFKKDELIETLKEIIHDNKLIRLSSADHAIAIMKKNGKYILYDSNQIGRELSFNSVEALATGIEKVLYKSLGKPSLYMDIAINIFRKSDETPAHYPRTNEQLKSDFLEKQSHEKNGNRDRVRGVHNALTFAAREGELSGIEALKKAGFDINHPVNSKKSTALTYAILQRHTEIAKTLIRAGAGIDYIDDDGYDAFTLAVIKKQTDVVIELVKAGANINVPRLRLNKMTPLMYAIIGKNTEMFNILIQEVKKPSDLDVIIKPAGISALSLAVESGNIEFVKALTRLGASLDVILPNGATVLMNAIKNEDLTMIDILIKEGANVDIIARDGSNALTQAVELGNENIVNRLLKSGAKLNIEIEGSSILMSSIMGNHVEITKALIKGGADLEYLSKGKNTALSLAIKIGNADIVKALVNSGANISDPIQGKTPLQLAKEVGNTEIIKIVTSPDPLRFSSTAGATNTPLSPIPRVPKLH